MNRDELRIYCMLVKRGKPAACIPLQIRHIDEAIEIVSSEGKLNIYTEDLYEGWVTFWVYSHPHILDVIKNVPQAPKSAYDHWIFGKLFGYEEAAIHEFIQTKRA